MALTDRLVRPPVLAAVLAFLAITPVAAGQGGYFPVAWGWMGLAYAWVGATALVLRREIRLSRAEIVMAAGALLVVLWTVATLLWTSNTTSTMLEAEHVLAYLAFVAALLVTCERASAIGLLVGTWAAITTVALYSLSTHLGPAVFGFYQDPLQPGRLFQPIGYWNALGIFCVMGITLALGLVDRHGPVVLRALAAASIAPLAATTYFTFSRGSWIALAVGVAWVVAFNPHRLRYLATALLVLPAPRRSQWRMPRRYPQLTAETASPVPDRRTRARGQRLRLAPQRRPPPPSPSAWPLRSLVSSVPRRARQGFAGLLVVFALACAAGGVAHYGSPVSRAHHLYRSLTAPPPTVAPTSSLNNRLLSASLNGRQYLWRVALDQFDAHPIAGGGAGTYGSYWLAHRTCSLYVVNAHSLYLETLAEEGIVGLAALLLLLAPALVAAIRFRASPEVTVASGAYVAYLVHAAVDWDWQVSGSDPGSARDRDRRARGCTPARCPSNPAWNPSRGTRGVRRDRRAGGARPDRKPRTI